MQQLSEFVINHWILVTAFCAVAGLLIANLVSTSTGVSTSEAVTLLNRSDAIVVDIRSEAEFAKAHIIDAINIPQTDIERVVQRLSKHKGKPVLVCCASGTASAAAARKMSQLGIENVQALRGGLAGWRQENLPVVSA